MNLNIEYYLIISLILFVCGVFVIISRKNIIAILLGLELILNASALNFIAYSKYSKNPIDAHIMTLFIIIVAAAEAAVGLGIVIRFFQLKESIHIDQATDLQS
jgi:NADH-quinone oxidoreductase subunit K